MVWDQQGDRVPGGVGRRQRDAGRRALCGVCEMGTWRAVRQSFENPGGWGVVSARRRQEAARFALSRKDLEPVSRR